MILIVLNYIVLALTFTVSKNVLNYADPLFTVGFRMIVAGLVLLGYLAIRNRASLVISRSDIGLFAGATILHIYLPYIAEYWSLQYMSSAKMNLLYSATPFLAALLSYYVLGESLGIKRIIGIALGFIGLLPVLMQQYPGAFFAPEFLRISYPEFLAITAVVSATYAWFVVKKLLARGYSFITINGIVMFCGGLIALGTSLLFEGSAGPRMIAAGLSDPNFLPFIGWVSVLILLANIIFYNLQTWLMSQYSISLVTLAGFLCPLFGALFGWLFLGELITWHYFCSLGLITIALLLYCFQEQPD